MDIATYRKNVFKTLSIKPAKAGLRYVSQNTLRTNVFHASVGLASEVMEVFGAISPYLLGSSRLSEQMKIEAFAEMGDLGYYMVVLAKCLKVKLPSSSKKVLLKGMTRSAALFELLRLSEGILDLSKKVLYGPENKMVDREIKVHAIGLNGEKSTSMQTQSVAVIDPAATLSMYAVRYAKAAANLEAFVPLFWALCYDMFEVPPANVFVGNIAKLSERYGSGFFELSEAEERDTTAENVAIQGGVKAAEIA